MSNTDTIAAIATPPGRGGVGIVRVSGPQTFAIAQKILGKLPAIRRTEYLPFKDQHQQTVDTGIALLFQKPHSFTGEDVLELQAHGGPVVLDLLLQAVFHHGARPARAGEFSEQAFLNNKLDLTQAEAIADLIEAESEQAVRAANRSLQGEFSLRIHQLVNQIIHLRVFVEASLDFPEEEVDFLSDQRIQQQLDAIKDELAQVMNSAQQGCLLKEGMTLVIAGRPNAGKSSLLNLLAGRESAIVTDIAGTTRDILKEHIQLDGLPLHIIDTAGLRDSQDPVEQEGIRRAWQAINAADRVLLLVDASDSQHDHLAIEQQLPQHLGRTRVYNKIDLCDDSARIENRDQEVDIWLSAKTGDGLALLQQHLKQVMGYQQGNEGQFMARRRHLQALQRAGEHIQQAESNLKQLQAGELMAEELRQAQEYLNQITGEFSSDDLLGEIFSSFCIGK